MRTAPLIAASLCVIVTAGLAGATPALADDTAPVPAPYRADVPEDMEELATVPPTRRHLAAVKPSTAREALTCAPRANTPVPDGQPIRVINAPAAPVTVGKIDSSYWNDPPVSDPSWRMWFWSLRWVSPLMRRAVEDGQTASQEALINQVTDFYRLNPDRGKPTSGWDEGASLRRLESLNCLYRLTSDKRLIAGMEAEARVQFGPRYYGPPFNGIHNHGLMANLKLIEASHLTNRPEWGDRARARLRAEAPFAFTKMGTTFEQSSTYQGVNRDLWAAAADALAAIDPADPTLPVLRGTVARATLVSNWLTEPDGDWVQFGDSHRSGGRPASPGSRVGVFRDDQAGLLIGRTSFADPKATMYTVRYGPGRTAHGHLDKGGVTWTPGGARVLIGSGNFSYETTDPFAKYQRAPESNNVAMVVGKTPNPRAAATLKAKSATATRRSWVTTDRVFATTHNRTITVDTAARRLTVADSFAGSGQHAQIWNLDPTWQIVNARRGSKTATFRHPDGRTLRIQTTGVIRGSYKGSTQPVAGWTFPEFRQRVPAWQLRIGWGKGTATTTFITS